MWKIERIKTKTETKLRFHKQVKTYIYNKIISIIFSGVK